VVFQSNGLRVNEEGGYDGYVTNKRVIFVKENKVQEIMNYHISSLSGEKKRWFGKGFLVIALLLSIILIWFLGIIAGLGIILILWWFLAKKEYLMIYGTGRQIKVEGNKYALEQLMAEARNQMSKVMEIPERVITPPISERVIIKEREIVKVRCPYCGTLADVTLNKCPNCGAKF